MSQEFHQEQVIRPAGGSLSPHSIESPQPTTPNLRHAWLVGGAVMLIGVASLFLFKTVLNPPAPPVTQIEEATPTSTPTPIRRVSQIATQGTFIALEQAHASLSAQLTATNLDDPSLSPPVLDLPLGFKQ